MKPTAAHDVFPFAALAAVVLLSGQVPVHAFDNTPVGAQPTTTSASTTPAAPATPADTTKPIIRPPGAVRSWNMCLLTKSGVTENVDVLRIRASRSGAGAVAGEIVYVDGSGARHTKPLGEVHALGPGFWCDASAAQPNESGRSIGTSTLELTDGQRLLGMIEDGKGDNVRLRTDRFGLASIPLDKLARWSRDGVPTLDGKAPTTDRLVYSNGDVREGVIETFGPTTVLGAKTSTASAQRTNVPLDALSSITFANPQAKSSEIVAWLSDGSVLALGEISIEGDGGRLRVRPMISGAGSDAAYLMPNEIFGLAFDAPSLVPLSSCVITSVRPLSDRPRTDPPRIVLPTSSHPATLGALDIDIGGAMTFDVALAVPARSLSAEVQLPDSAWMWGDCELVLRVVTAGTEREAARVRVYGGKSVMPLNARLDAPAGSTLRISLEPGAYGAVQARVVLKHALLNGSPR